jgi:NAD(P)H dehydrogenase (quinone)
MILVTLPKTTPGFQVAGMHWGFHGRSGGAAMEPINITDEMKLAGHHHGANIARIAAQLRGKDLLARGNVAPSSELLEQFTQVSS